MYRRRVDRFYLWGVVVALSFVVGTAVGFKVAEIVISVNHGLETVAGELVP